ncbi:hypothetical protein [Streptomyces odonnellii]|uniref:hypothetical protein n=1 Tax=Streptomyces odonnellii TaxID=1417980 RepID=UPI000ACB1FA4|nr:hypothetical protein [Streptomyces odonnellii]
MTSPVLSRLLAASGALLGRYRLYIKHAPGCPDCSTGQRCAAGDRLWQRFLDARGTRP